MLGIVSAVGAGLNLIGGITKTISGAKRERSARNALANYQRQNPENVYDSVGVSTLGADLLREQASQGLATSVDALRAAGSRGVVGGLGAATAAFENTNRRAAADLDAQRRDIDIRRAEDDARIRNMIERREEQDIFGLGQEINAARQDKFGGIGDISGSLMSIGALGGDAAMGKLLKSGSPTAQQYLAASMASATATGGIGALSSMAMMGNLIQ